MNIKAEKFNAFIEEKMPKIFKATEIPEHELHAMTFESTMEVEKQNLPCLLVIDDSIFTMFQVRLAYAVVKEGNKAAVMEHLNQLNRQYKVFKYDVDANGSILLECCLPAGDDNFEPAIVQSTISVVLQHLEQEYQNIMRIVWSK